jgi:S1-C subfamily serine protease
LLTGCGIARLINPPQKWHEDPYFKNDPDFGAWPENYRHVSKTAKQIAETTPTVYIELVTNPGNWFGVAGDELTSASGVIVEYSGRPYIISAGHITMERTTAIDHIYAYFPDSKLPPEEVEIFAYDPLLDFSLLRFKNEKSRINKPYPVIGRSADLRPGQKLIALGSPLSMRYSVSDGLVMNATMGCYNLPMPQPQLIIHNITGNPGSSGGPVLNEYGELVGIFTGALLGAPSPMPYAVPIDDIVHVLRRLKEPGEIKHPKIDLKVYNTWEWSPSDFKSKEIPLPDQQGVFVSKDDAPTRDKKSWNGLCRGDLVMEINGVAVDNAMQFWKYLLLHCRSGQTVDFKINRVSKEMTIEMKLK